MDNEALQKQNADLLVALRQAYEAVQQFKGKWLALPNFGQRLNREIRQGMSEAVGIIVNLDAVGGPLDLNRAPAANAVAVPQSRDKDWGATWDAVFKALDPYTIGSGTRGEFNAAVNDVVVAVMANMAPATSENI